MDKKTIALVGNPNSGKTTFFNGLTGGRQQTGNWPGVTVDKIEGDFKEGNSEVHVVDLPGIYSLSAYSEDEQVARDYILGGEADLIVNIIDASNIERNLYLTTHLLEMNVPMMIILNMKDVATSKEIHVNTKRLAEGLGIPMEYITATRKKEVALVKTAILNAANAPKITSARISYENEVEEAIKKLEPELSSAAQAIKAPQRWLGLKLLEEDSLLEKQANSAGLSSEKIQNIRDEIEHKIGDEPDIVIADGRYGFIHGLVKSAVTKGEPKKCMTDKIDSIVLNRFLGIPIFLLVMYAVFWATISFGGAFIDFFDIFSGTIFVDGTAALLGMINAPEWIVAFVSTGLGGGIQTIATFVPIIFMLYFIMSLLEDSGYMARGAFVMDRLMRVIGLPGKAFIPMMVGFGCTVPAIMATRTLENKRDRLLTIFMSPFMSCGARLPVYALFAAAFFPKSGQNVVFLLYIIGIVLAVLTGMLLKKSFFAGEAAPFVMELPIYHAPRMGHIFIHTWEKLKGFVLKAGKVLMVIVTLLGLFNSLGTDGSWGNEDSESSVLAVAGKAVTPLFRPFGIEEKNWPASVGLFTGLFAKEVVVGTLNSLYSTAADEGEGEEDEFDFWAGIGEAFGTIPENVAGAFDIGALADPFGMKIGDVSDESVVSGDLEVEPTVFKEMRSRFTGGSKGAFAYLLFILLYVPCLVAVAAAFKEMGWKLTLFQAYYSTMLAWVIATLYYQITFEHNGLFIVSAILLFVVSLAGIFGWAKYEKRKEA